jgi:non-ribosomal peptide synthetase component F
VLEDFTVEQQLQLPGIAVQPLHGVMPQTTLVNLTVNLALTRCGHALTLTICIMAFSCVARMYSVLMLDPAAWHLTCRSGCLHGHVLGAADLFEAATIRQLAEHLKVLAGAAAAQPDASISSLPLMSAEEQQLVLHTFNDTAGPLPTLCVHQFFEQQAARTPVAKCLMAGAGGISLTYAEVNSRANQLAHHLIVAGVTSDMPVAVLMDKCFEAYIALIAILKAGGEQLDVFHIVHIVLREDLLTDSHVTKAQAMQSACRLAAIVCMPSFSMCASTLTSTMLILVQAATCPLTTRRPWSGCTASSACLGAVS